MTYEEISDLINTNLISGSGILAIKHREVEHALLDFINVNLAQQGDIKRIKCDLTYLNANFEIDGTGKNLRAGWAICNGNNGTDNLAGRVGVGYGTGYSTLSATGGEKEHTLLLTEMPAHSHEINMVGYNLVTGGGAEYVVRSSGTQVPKTTTSKGNTAPHNNMQPYIVQLYIMKL